MDNQHPITPPPELVDRWVNQSPYIDPEGYIATQAAQWGADMELEACVNYVDNTISGNKARALRAIRRPKPPSLKEQALKALHASVGLDEFPEQYHTIRRALEQLP